VELPVVLAVDELRPLELEELRPRDEAEPVMLDWLDCALSPCATPMTVGMPNKFVSIVKVLVVLAPVPVPAALAFDADSAFIAASLSAELIASPTVSAVLSAEP
jgi:hypothetical protein